MTPLAAHRHAPTPHDRVRSTTSLALIAGLFLATAVSIAAPFAATPASAAHPDLTLEIISAPNFVVDSNIESPSSYGPEAAHVAAKVCNTGSDTMTDVLVMSGDFDPDGVGGYADSTPGTYPAKTHPGLTGTFSFTHEGGPADAARFIGNLAPGECTTQYYLISYPTLDDLGNSVTGGRTTDDDMSLDFDMWVTATDPVDGPVFTDETATATLRSEISAMANKIWPNTTSKVPPEYLAAFEEQLGWTPDPDGPAGNAARLQGVWYDLGRVNKGYDADGDFLPDFDLWMQPVGDAGLYDPACTRLVRTYGVVIVKKNDGSEDIIAFEDQLYFKNVAENNIGAIGLVFYEFATIGAGCSSALTPYQEVASGSNNEKFNGDYGTSAGVFSPSAPTADFDKAASPAAVVSGGTITYDLSLTNNSATETLGLTDFGLPPVIQETIPTGSTYVLGSASTVTQPSGTTTTTLYYDAGSASWTSTEPTIATNVSSVQWWLDADIPATETFATRFQVTAAPIGGQVVVENTGGGSFGGGATFLTDTTNTFINGANSLGDTVFADDGGTTGTPGDGIQNGDEAGIDDIGVSLYVDVNSDGNLDAGDLLWTTTSSAGGGSYSFPNLPDANFLVVIDDDDIDITTGWGPSTATTIAITLAGADDLTADFGLAPALVIDKALVGASPVNEGDRITYTIDVSNQLKVAGQATTQDLWLTVLDGGASTFGSPSLALNGPDGSGAIGNTPSNYILRATQPITADTWSVISDVSLVIDYSLTAPLSDDDVDVIVTKSGTPLTKLDITTPTLNAGTPGQLVVDITTLDGVTWTWADLQAASTGLEIDFVKNGGTDGPDFLVDAFGFRVAALPAGGFDAATTLSPVPLTDTYDPTKLDFVSASVAPTNVDEGTGTITWTDVGPINGGDTTQIEVTFDVISSTTATASFTADNTVSSTTATFADGDPTNSATDVETITVDPQGTISGTLWSESAAGTNGWVGATGVESGTDYGLPTVAVELYACVTATGDPTAPGTLTTNACGAGGTGTNWAVFGTTTTDANGAYDFEGLPTGFYYVDVDETTVPSGQVATAEADLGAGVAGNQNNTGANCGTCDGIWGTPAATENSGLFNTINTVGEDITNISFGYTTDAAVYGNLWEDVDGDGTQDAGDTPLSGWTVTAFDGTTSYVAISDAKGDYVIDGLAAAVGYTISVTTPGGETWTETFETDTVVDNAASVTLAAGEINGSWDFAFTHTDASTIGDTIYWDWNGNGTQDVSDEGVDGVTVDLYRDGNADGIGDVFVATTTTVDGAYSFALLPAGDYVVIADESIALLTAGATGDPDEIGICVTCDGQATVTVDGTASDLAQDFGYRPQGSASIGDTVYYDANGDGTQGATELGLANITVSLLADMDGDGTYVVIAMTVTDANGKYTFGGLPDAAYRVVVDSADTDLPDDGVGNLVVPVVSDTVDVTIAGGASDDTADVGYAALGAIGDVVFSDANGNGTQDVDELGWPNVTVTLWEDTDDNGSYETQVGAPTTTDASGKFLFTGLEPGDYEVRVDSADPDLGGAAQTGDPDRDGETCTDETYILLADVPCDGADSKIVVNYGTNYYGADFGYQPPGVVGDFVWNDANDNGLQDVGEPGLADVTIEIWQDTDVIPDGIGDVLFASTFTDSDGNYSFSSLPDDNYVVVIDTASLPFTMVATVGAESAGAATSPVAVAGGAIDLSVDFGFKISGTSSLAGTVCLEASGATNGACDVPASENELADVVVYLYDASNVFLGSTTTGPNGGYSFSGIPDGTYTVSIGTTRMPLSIADTTTPTATEAAAATYQPATVSGATTDVDFAFVQVIDIDLGDLDSPYDATLETGPYHTIGSLFLGAGVDADAATLANADATGDDLDGTDDEDGVSFDSTLWTPDAVADGDDGSVDIVVSGGSGFFLGWIDWNGDGAFTGTGELVANRTVSAGATTVSFDIPDGTDLSADLAARFRLFAEAPTLPSLAYTGGAINGEVEDYLVLGPIVPDAVDDAYGAVEDTTLTISTIATGVMTNDDQGNAPATVTSFDSTSTQGGTVAVAADGTFTYTPPDDYVGADTFTYTITDDTALTDTATVTITVADGGSPDAIDDTATIPEGTTTVTTIDAIGSGDVLTDDATYELGSLDTTGTTGTVTDNDDGTFGYVPAPAFSGDDTFTYTICDDDVPASPTSCDTATVTVTVTDTGSPDAIDDTATIPEGTTTVTTIDAIGSGDVLTDDATYELGSLDTTGTTGTVTDNDDGTFGYVPAPAFSGDDTFTYTICDDDVPASPTSCDTATVTVTVTDTGSPDAIDDTATIPEGTTTVTTIDAIGSGDVLTDDATYELGSLDTTGTTGTVTDNDDGTFGYVPAPAFSGDDTFTYTICDDDVPASPTSCDTATVTVTVTDTGSPDAIDDTATIPEGTTTVTTIDAIGSGDVLTDDATYELGSLDTTGTTGTVTDNDDGTFGYVPAPAFSGDDTFTYTICDDDVPASPTSCDTATVTVTVTDTGSPDAIDDTATIPEGTTTVTTIDAIGSGDVLTDDATYELGSLDTTGTTGTVTDNDDGTFGYVPAPAFSGDDTFTYTICDDDVPASPTSCDTATVTVTVTDTGSPDAIDDTATIPEGTTTVTTIDAIGSGDVLTDDATYELGSLDTTGTTGTVTDNDDGTFGYVPAPAFSGDDTFTYTICDDDVPASPTSCDTATVTVTVTDTGSPDAIDDTATIPEGTTTVTTIDAIGSGDVLTDDATYELGSLDTTGTTGTVTDNDDGTFGYVPAPAFSGDDTFTYTICDDDVPASPTSCDTATVTVTVTDTGSPDAIDDTATIPEGTTTVTTIDAIGSGDVLTDDATYELGSLDTTGTTGTVTDNDDGTFGYVPAPAFSGDDTFTYTICDDDVPASPTSCDTATVTVTVTDTGSATIPEGTTTVTTIDAIGSGDVLTDDATSELGSLDTTGTTGTVTDNSSSVDPLLPSTGAEIRMHLTRSFMVLALGVLLIVGSRRRRHRVL